MSCKILLSFSSLWNSIHCFQLNVKSNRRLLWFSCTCYVIGSENSRYFPNQSKQNPKPSRFGHPRFPRLTVWSFLFRVLIGSSWHYPWHDWLLNLCWFCFTTLNRKPFNYDVFINFFFYFSSLDNLIASKPSRTEQGMIKLEKDAFRFCTFWNFRAQLVVLKPQDL